VALENAVIAYVAELGVTAAVLDARREGGLCRWRQARQRRDYTELVRGASLPRVALNVLVDSGAIRAHHVCWASEDSSSRGSRIMLPALRIPGAVGRAADGLTPHLLRGSSNSGSMPASAATAPSKPIWQAVQLAIDRIQLIAAGRVHQIGHGQEITVPRWCVFVMLDSSWGPAWRSMMAWVRAAYGHWSRRPYHLDRKVTRKYLRRWRRS